MHLRDADPVRRSRTGSCPGRSAFGGSAARARAAPSSPGRAPRRARRARSPGPPRRPTGPRSRRHPRSRVTCRATPARTRPQPPAPRAPPRSWPRCARRSRPVVGERPRLAGQRRDRAVDLDPPLLDRTRDADRPARVAEVALDLAEDRRHREARERRAAVELVAVDRLDEPDARHLDQVVDRLAGGAVAPRELARQREEARRPGVRAPRGRPARGRPRTAGAPHRCACAPESLYFSGSGPPGESEFPVPEP